jgi:uncharacterized protein YabN with tetrapyrrole methylase and pyrophosphatase domain
MEKSFRELFEALKISRKKCPWAKEQTLEEHCRQLISEAKELRQAIKENNSQEIMEELGDVLWDAIFLGIIAEEKNLFSLKDSFESALKKLKRRKPWVFGKESVSSKKEAVKRWKEIKELEKKQLNNFF